MGSWSANDMIYRGIGAAANNSHDALRLTRLGGPVSRWNIPAWLQDKELTYHRKPWRWSTTGQLTVVARGQEFVCDVGDDPVAHAWADGIIDLIHR